MQIWELVSVWVLTQVSFRVGGFGGGWGGFVALGSRVWAVNLITLPTLPHPPHLALIVGFRHCLWRWLRG